MHLVYKYRPWVLNTMRLFTNSVVTRFSRNPDSRANSDDSATLIYSIISSIVEVSLRSSSRHDSFRVQLSSMGLALFEWFASF